MPAKTLSVIKKTVWQIKKNEIIFLSLFLGVALYQQFHGARDVPAVFGFVIHRSKVQTFNVALQILSRQKQN